MLRVPISPSLVEPMAMPTAPIPCKHRPGNNRSMKEIEIRGIIKGSCNSQRNANDNPSPLEIATPNIRQFINRNMQLPDQPLQRIVEVYALTNS